MTRSYPERALQIGLVSFLRTALVPPAEVFSVPNGGLLPGGSKVARARAGALRRAMGLNPGTPDLGLMWPAGFGWLELKAAGGSLSDDQKRFRDSAAACACRWAQVRTIPEAEDVLREWGVPMRASVRPIVATTAAALTSHDRLRAVCDRRQVIR